MFKFGFGEENRQEETSQSTQTDPAQLHDFSLLRQAAPRISYTGYAVPKTEITLPRRDFFDARYQLMSEDNLSESDQLLLGSEDVRKTVYEGGLKVWEGTGDLLEVLAEHSETSVIELGCGAGIPGCLQLYKALKANLSGRFVLADYNTSVLRLITMPNVVLAWLAATKGLEDKGEINLTAELIDECAADLAKRGVAVHFVSGGWSPQFVQLVGQPFDLVLASETIYSLDSIVAFTDVLAAVKGKLALVAAKKVYFGVGGGVIEFQRQLDKRQLSHHVVLETGSVGRVVLAVE